MKSTDSPASANDAVSKTSPGHHGGGRHHSDPKPSLEYLQELLKDKRQLNAVPAIFHHLERLLDNEINKVRIELFHINRGQLLDENALPEATGQTVSLQEKVYIPIKENPSYNFVGRLLGPGGMTAKHMEKCLGCKIMIRGRGSMRDKKKEETNRGKPNWEHLNDDLHVLISVEDTQNRAEIKLQRAVDEVGKFLDEALKTPESEDKLKQMQLMELAARNEANKPHWLSQPWLTAAAAANPFLRGLPNPGAAAGAPMILAGPRFHHGNNAAHQQTIFSPDGAMFPYQQSGNEYLLTTSPAGAGLIDYSNQMLGLEPSAAGILRAVAYQSFAPTHHNNTMVAANGKRESP